MAQHPVIVGGRLDRGGHLFVAEAGEQVRIIHHDARVSVSRDRHQRGATDTTARDAQQVVTGLLRVHHHPVNRVGVAGRSHQPNHVARYGAVR